MLKRINIILILLLAALIPIAYTPNIYLNHSLYMVFSNSITLLLGLIFGFTVFKFNILNKERIPDLIKKLVYLVFIISVEFLFFYAKSLNFNIQDLISLIAVIIGLYVGYANNLTTIQIKSLIVVYCVFSIILGYLSIGTYVGNFSIYTADYLVEGKNQVGQLIALCVILSFYISFFEDKKIYKLLFYAIFVIAFFFMIIIKCKTAILASFFVVCLFIYKLFQRITKQKFFLVGLPIILIIGLFYLESIIYNVLEIIGLTDKMSSMEDLTTGRASRNEKAINYILDNPFTGELINSSNIALIHNWLLLRLTRYGIFAFPFIAFYLTIFIYSVKIIRKIKKWNFRNMGFLLVLVPYISSIVEPNAPFSPNTVYIIHYIILGIGISKCKMPVLRY